MNVNNNFIEENYKLIQYISNKVGYKLGREDKEDLINDTVVKILQSDEEVLEDGASAYINKVMRNVLIDLGRTNNTDAITHATFSLDQEIDERLEREGGMTYHEVIEDGDSRHFSELYRDDIHDLCSRLPPRQAEVFNMRYYLGMTPEEIAQKLGIENKAVRMALLRAVENAHKLIDEG